jgi:hypothetical protein
MPELARFYGIVVQVYYGDHLPPHVHVQYSGHSAKIDIESLALIDGELPARAIALVTEWATLHRDELRVAFNKAANLQKPGSIDPLP